ncbi:folate-binding protein [Nibricoccus aquaticus]|uniref:Folate-binding protein n=1 Tax=Nibricoccus aquaticus TaxID=2576891 RepID=A0A290Q7D2_9BACT|nr:folate-binding protein [Nibricoccus aquaticus]ATC64323.1 folate-binding protein [Nibricoccus aquaticus]
MNFGARVRFNCYQPAAVLRVSGEDALSFLQGQFTQDLKMVEAGAAAYGLWLNQKGKVLADSFVLRAEGGVWWVISYFSAAVVIRERLESYLIADDVVIEDETVAWEGVSVMGAGEGEGAEVKAWLAGRVGLIWQGRRAAVVTWEWLRPKGSSLEMGAEAEEISEEELEHRRIESGIPAVPRDVGAGDLPNEAGLEEVAVSYTKGCYLGQEVMARLKAMGQVRRRLLKVEGAGMPGALPAGLFHGEKRVGEVRSAVKAEAGWSGLAMVSLLGMEGVTALSLTPGGAAEVEVFKS